MIWLATLTLAQSLFDYATLPPLACDDTVLAARQEALIQGCAFDGPSGGQINLVLVTPRKAKPPYAGVVFQHGGGQSMTNYLSEALILARSGVVSMLTDAPARGNGHVSDITQTKLAATQKHQAEIIVALRMAIELLARQKNVDPRRIAYVGHSYGAMAGAAIAALEPRLTTVILLGGLPSLANHLRHDPGSREWRESMTSGELQETLEMLKPTEPTQFLANATPPLFIQCARFDTPTNVKGCPELHRLAKGKGRLAWYDDDHHFTSWEAARDRLYWLSQRLGLPSPAKHAAALFAWQP